MRSGVVFLVGALGDAVGVVTVNGVCAASAFVLVGEGKEEASAVRTVEGGGVAD